MLQSLKKQMKVTSEIILGQHKSSFLHVINDLILPILKTVIFFLCVIMVFIGILYISVVNSFDISAMNKDKEKINKKERLVLSGRLKRSPDNINYNELFKAETEKKNKKKKGEEKILIDTNYKENVLDNFVEIVNEKLEYKRIFEDEMRKDDNKPEVIEVKGTANEDLLVFENKKPQQCHRDEQSYLLPSEYSLKKDGVRVSKVKECVQAAEAMLIKRETEEFKDKTIPDHVDSFQTKENLQDLENDYSIIEEKIKKYSNIYLQTPLLQVRKNTISSKK